MAWLLIGVCCEVKEGAEIKYVRRIEI
jgi:hypothetical protein